MAKYKVVSTKKLSPALVQQAKQKSIDIFEQEFIAIHPIVTREKIDEVNYWTANQKIPVVFTSSNAVEILRSFPGTITKAKWKAFSLSGKTKEALQSCFPGIEIKYTADNASLLAEKIIEHNAKEVLFFCGNKRRDELPEIVKANGVTVHEVVLYETTETPVTITEQFEGILFFSPGAVRSFFSANQLRPQTICFAIGQTTAGAIAEHTKNRIIISESPVQEVMVSSVISYFQNTNCCNE